MLVNHFLHIPTTSSSRVEVSFRVKPSFHPNARNARGAGSPGQGGQLTPLKFGIGVKKIDTSLMSNRRFLTLTPC